MTNDKNEKNLVSVQDFILNNPEALNNALNPFVYRVYDWSDTEEVENILNSPE